MSEYPRASTQKSKTSEEADYLHCSSSSDRPHRRSGGRLAQAREANPRHDRQGVPEDDHPARDRHRQDPAGGRGEDRAGGLGRDHRHSGQGRAAGSPRATADEDQARQLSRAGRGAGGGAQLGALGQRAASGRAGQGRGRTTRGRRSSSSRSSWLRRIETPRRRTTT